MAETKIHDFRSVYSPPPPPPPPHKISNRTMSLSITVTIHIFSDMIYKICLLIAVLLFCLLSLYCIANMYLYVKRRRYKDIASPELKPGLLWVLGHLSTIGSRINPETSFTALLWEISKEVDDYIFILFFLNRNFLIVLEPTKTSKILTNHRVFQKMGGKQDNMAYINGTRVFGERGMVTEVGSDLWYHKRKTMDGAFHKNSLKNLMGQMNDIGQKLTLYLTKDENTDSCDIYKIFTRVALETICRCGFNLNDDLIFSEDSILSDAFHHIFYAAQLQFQCSLKFMLPWAFRKEKRALHDHITMVRTSLARRLNDKILQQKKGQDTKDMLDYIIKGNFYDGELHAEDVLDDFFVFVVAGMETTAIVMSLVIFYMLKNPEICAKVRYEVSYNNSAQLNMIIYIYTEI